MCPENPIYALAAPPWQTATFLRAGRAVGEVALPSAPCPGSLPSRASPDNGSSGWEGASLLHRGVPSDPQAPRSKAETPCRAPGSPQEKTSFPTDQPLGPHPLHRHLSNPGLSPYFLGAGLVPEKQEWELPLGGLYSCCSCPSHGPHLLSGLVAMSGALQPPWLQPMCLCPSAVHSVTLFLNLLACLAWFLVDSSKGVDFGLSILWFVIFTPCAFLCWYRPIYKAFR